MCKSPLFDTYVLSGSGNRLLYTSRTKYYAGRFAENFYRSQADLNIMHACTLDFQSLGKNYGEDLLSSVRNCIFFITLCKESFMI